MLCRYIFLCFIAMTHFSNAAMAETRQAKCLLEVKGVHYIGGPCLFTPLDQQGSFRITDVQDLKLTAQVNVSKKDQGYALWNGPSVSKESKTVLGDVYRSGGCWILSGAPDSNRYNDALICAWDENGKFYLGASPQEPPTHSIVYYGSRIGMFYDVTSRHNLDSSDAIVITKPSKDGAVIFCRDYGRDFSLKCIDDALREPRTSSLRGDCKEGTFSDFEGTQYKFLGKTPKDDREVFAANRIKNIVSGDILDGSMASGYGIALGIYQALCPSSAPKESN